MNLKQFILEKEELEDKMLLTELKEKYEIDLSKFDSDQVKAGTKVEKEHENLYSFLNAWNEAKDVEFPLSEEEFYQWIAAVHLNEIKDYYDRLAGMEKEAKKSNESEKPVDKKETEDEE